MQTAAHLRPCGRDRNGGKKVSGIKSRVPALILLAVMVLGLFCAGPRAQAAGSALVVGVRDDIVNFSYLNETTGKFYGLEIDLAKELAKRLGREDVEFVAVTPTTREQVLQNGEVDCLIACYSINEEREELFDFSAPYYSDDTVFMVQTSSCFTRWMDLGGMTVGVLAGSNTGDLVKDTMKKYSHKGVQLHEEDTYQDLSDALERGDVDAVCMDGCIAQAFMNEDRIYLPGSLATQTYGVATQKGSELSEQVAAAMDEMLSDGTVDQFIDKWD